MWWFLQDFSVKSDNHPVLLQFVVATAQKLSVKIMSMCCTTCSWVTKTQEDHRKNMCTATETSKNISTSVEKNSCQHMVLSTIAAKNMLTKLPSFDFETHNHLKLHHIHET